MVEPPVQHRGWAADLIWCRAQNRIQVRVDSRETARGTARIDDRGEPAVRRLPPFDLHARRSQQRLSPPLCIDPGALDFIGERLTQIWRSDVDHFAAAGEEVGQRIAAWLKSTSV